MADPRFSMMADKSTDDNEAIQFVSEEVQGGRDLFTAADAQDWEALEFVR